MEIFTDDLSLEDFEEEVSDMVTLSKRTTGLDYLILMDSLGRERNRKNNSPRLMIAKVKSLESLIPVSIDEFNPKILIDREVKDFESIADWIRKFYPILMKHWNQQINDVILMYLLCKDLKLGKAWKIPEWAKQMKQRLREELEAD